MNNARNLPTPRGHLLLGHLPDLKHDMLGFFERCAREHGDAVRMRFGLRQTILLSHPDDIEQVLVSKARHFTKDWAINQLRFALGNGLLLSEGEQWKSDRKRLGSIFDGDQTARAMPFITDQIGDTVHAWNHGETITLHRELLGLAMKSIACYLGGPQFAQKSNACVEAVQKIMAHVGHRYRSLVPIPAFIPTQENRNAASAVHELDSAIREIVDFHRVGNGRGVDGRVANPLSTLVRLLESGVMTYRQVRDHIATLLLAGHETTATALFWTFHLLDRNPSVDEALYAEVANVLCGRAPAFEDLKRLVYARQVIRETLRLFPPAYAVTRQVRHECSIGKLRLRCGTRIKMSQWVVHRDDRWFDSPLEFRPCRWQESAEGTRPKFAYFPFGGGARQCFGASWAMDEAVLILAMLVQRFRVDFQGATKITIRPSVTLSPEHNVNVRLMRRDFSRRQDAPSELPRLSNLRRIGATL